MKIARNVEFSLKEGKHKEFLQLMESKVLPVLRQQNGFREELTLIDTNRALVISFWDDRKNADMYHVSVYPQLVEKLSPVVQATPKITVFDVAQSTTALAA